MGGKKIFLPAVKFLFLLALLAVSAATAAPSSDIQWVSEVFRKKVNENWPKGAEEPGFSGSYFHPYHDWLLQEIVLGDRRFEVRMARFSSERTAVRMVDAVRGMVSVGGDPKDARLLGLDELDTWGGYWALGRKGMVAIMITPKPQFARSDAEYNAMIQYLSPLIDAEERKVGGISEEVKPDGETRSVSTSTAPGDLRRAEPGPTKARADKPNFGKDSEFGRSANLRTFLIVVVLILVAGAIYCVWRKRTADRRLNHRRP